MRWLDYVSAIQSPFLLFTMALACKWFLEKWRARYNNDHISIINYYKCYIGREEVIKLNFQKTFPKKLEMVPSNSKFQFFGRSLSEINLWYRNNKYCAANRSWIVRASHNSLRAGPLRACAGILFLVFFLLWIFLRILLPSAAISIFSALAFGCAWRDSLAIFNS